MFSVHVEERVKSGFSSFSNVNEAVWFRLDSDSDQTTRGWFIHTMSKVERLWSSRRFNANYELTDDTYSISLALM